MLQAYWVILNNYIKMGILFSLSTREYPASYIIHGPLSMTVGIYGFSSVSVCSSICLGVAFAKHRYFSNDVILKAVCVKILTIHLF